MNQSESRSSNGDKPRPIGPAAWAGIAQAVAGAVGLGGLLYGAGFLIVRSHRAALGLWTGIPLEPSELAEEGGRFFFHLCYLPVSLLVRFDARTWTAIFILALGADLVFLVSARRRIGTEHRKKYQWPPLLAKAGRALAKFGHALAVVQHLDTLLVAMALAVTVLPLDLLWQVVEAGTLLASPPLSPQATSLLHGADTYASIVIRVAWGVAVGSGVFVCYWKRGTLLRRALIILQWIVIVAAIGALPIAYGKLMLSTAYPTFSISRLAADERAVLVGRSEEEWVVWSVRTKQTLVFKRKDDEVVTIGPKQTVTP